MMMLSKKIFAKTNMFTDVRGYGFCVYGVTVTSNCNQQGKLVVDCFAMNRLKAHIYGKMHYNIVHCNTCVMLC